MGIDTMCKELEKMIGQKIQLITPASPPAARPPNITGVLKEVTEVVVKIQLQNEQGEQQEERERIGVFRLNQIIGFVPVVGEDGGCCKPGEQLENQIKSRKGITPGMITLEIAIAWPEGVKHPDEVNIILIREDTETVARTIEGKVILLSKPGKVIVTGEDVPGFITPVLQLRLRGKDRLVNETLKYVAAQIPVEKVVLNKHELTLLEAQTEQLIAEVLPVNAKNQNVEWESSDESVAKVNNGLVTALAEGLATITVISEDGGKTDSAIVTVLTIVELINPEPITALVNEVILLPETVTVVFSNESVWETLVAWKLGDEELGRTFEISECPESQYFLTGVIIGTDLTAELIINITEEEAIRVTGVSVEPTLASLYGGDMLTLIPTIIPADATTQALIWSSSDENIVVVDDEGKITALTAGLAIITVETVDGGYQVFSQISVSEISEIDLVYPTQLVYDNPEDVVINVENLVKYVPITSPTIYYVKVEQKGTEPLLGGGIVTIKPDTNEFNLYEVTEFKTTDNYSNEYFVYMSTDPAFPHEEDMTLKTNFKIGSAVPTVPKENIIVTLEIIGGPLNDKPGGVIFFLARVLEGYDVCDLTWEYYTINPEAPDEEKEFSDEVKLIGRTDSEGLVIWEEPDEALKLGGYVLLEVTPVGYVDSLNLLNPEVDDGTLLKEITLKRDGFVVRNVIDTYVGE